MPHLRKRPLELSCSLIVGPADMAWLRRHRTSQANPTSDRVPLPLPSRGRWCLNRANEPRAASVKRSTGRSSSRLIPESAATKAVSYTTLRDTIKYITHTRSFALRFLGSAGGGDDRQSRNSSIQRAVRTSKRSHTPGTDAIAALPLPIRTSSDFLARSCADDGPSQKEH